MENILLKYQQNTSYAKCFEILETELATSLETARPEEMVLVLKQEVFDRLSLVNPALKTKSNLYTYAESVSEIVQPEHPIYNLFTKNVIDAIEYEWNHGDNTGQYEADEFYITAISMNTVEAFLEVENAEKGTDVSDYIYAYSDMSFLVSFDRFIFDRKDNLENHIAKHSIYKNKQEIIKEYFEMTVELNTRSNEFYETGLDKSSTTAEIATNHTRYEFKKRLDKAVGECINVISSSRWKHFKEHATWKFNLSNMFSVMLNIANLNETEWTRFITGYYTEIPHIKRKKSPKSAVILFPIETNKFRFLEDKPYEVIIKGETDLVHIIISDSRGKCLKFDRYDLNEGAKIIVAGNEVEITADCFEGDNLTLFEMIHIGNENIAVSTNFKFDTRTFKHLALSYQDGNVFLKYMHDRAGLHNRKM